MKEMIKLEKVQEDKSKIYLNLRVRVGFDWNLDIVDNTMAEANYKARCFFENNESRIPKDLESGLNSYFKLCFEQIDGISEIADVEFQQHIQNQIPKECIQSYDKFLTAHAEFEKLKVQKEIEELENKAKQLKEKLNKLKTKE